MSPRTRRLLATGSFLALAVGSAISRAQQPTPDLVLSNGRIITVDDRFSISEAIAVSGQYIAAVGTSQQIATMVGPDTRTIDLEGRAVIPGLIDNHMHLLRAGMTWRREVRWDGVETRARALEMLRARVGTTVPGEWIFTLGGWTLEQFGDDDSPFTREELDRAAPDNPVLLQATYYRSYLNSPALQALGLDTGPPGEPWVVRDVSGRPTGEIEEAGIRGLVAGLPAPSRDEIEESTRAMIRDLNRAGVTAVGSAGCPRNLVQMYRNWADRDQLDIRVFCIDGPRAATPEEVDEALPRIAGIQLFQGDSFIDDITLGEGIYGPLHDPMFVVDSNPSPDDLLQWRRMITEIARARLPLHVHANHRVTISAFLDQIEQVDEDYPIRNLRWAFAHVNQLEASHLERMKALGMYAAVHPWAVITGGIQRAVFGDAAYDMAPLRTIQDSGITWGFGSDGSRANQILPFATLSWAVTGEMVGGAKVLRQTISREEALIAHTRKNAYLVFREDELGSIQAGKLADLVVLDRDYLTIPTDQIKEIAPVMTIVDGRVVYDARAQREARAPTPPDQVRRTGT